MRITDADLLDAIKRPSMRTARRVSVDQNLISTGIRFGQEGGRERTVRFWGTVGGKPPFGCRPTLRSSRLLLSLSKPAVRSPVDGREPPRVCQRYDLAARLCHNCENEDWTE
jgi:hypothetical protein